MKAILLASLAAVVLQAQTPAPPVADATAKEQQELSEALGEAAGSQIDLIHALEQHLKKYPDTKRRAEIEKALAKAAMDTNDNARIVLWGEKVLQAEPADGFAADDMQLLDRVTRALVDLNEPEHRKAALEYAKRYEADVAARRAQPPPGHLTAGQWSEELDRAMARALVLEARAPGDAGDPEAAAKIALRAWATYPTGEGAREAAFWLVKLDRTAEAIEYYADAFTLEDPRSTEIDRARDRARMGELYSKAAGSEKGLGEIVLQAYDRTSALMGARVARLRALDPNEGAKNVEDFVLTAVGDAVPALALSSLKGKTVVMDFWATWCAPCRAQKPLIEDVRRHYAEAKDIVFLAVDADDDPGLVRPFVKQQEWTDGGYFEGGLARRLTIASIPTVLVLDPSGQIFSRMVGFIPDKFEEMLTQRIEEARGKSQAKPDTGLR